MSKKKKTMLGAGIAAVLVLAAVIWLLASNVFVGGRIYSRNASELDLRGTGIDLEDYEALRQKLPECEIRWDLPFQGSYYSNDIKQITVSTLTDEDVALLDYLPQLETVDARGCRDYAQLAALQARRPECAVLYTVGIDGTEYPQDTAQIDICAITEEEIGLLEYLPALKSVNAEQCRDYDALMKLSKAYPGCHVSYRVSIAGESYGEDAAEVTAVGADISEVAEKLVYLPQVESVHLVNPAGGAEELFQLVESLPNVAFSWEMDVLGVTVRSDDTEADLSGITMESTDTVAEAMEYFPNVEKLILCGCGIDNEVLAEFRESKRPEYKVVWSVAVGALTVRTDDTWFMPGKFKKGLTQEGSYNLRYCEDMVCIDVGHKPINGCEWAAYMPDLKYLILADTQVRDLTPLAGLKKLIYLEIFMTPVTDYTPLLGCTALEDLNLSDTYGDPAVIAQMTWLKNVWWNLNWESGAYLKDKLPNTNLCYNQPLHTDGGWRQLPNYYDMRDYLGMYYMF